MQSNAAPSHKSPVRNALGAALLVIPALVACAKAAPNCGADAAWAGRGDAHPVLRGRGEGSPSADVEHALSHSGRAIYLRHDFGIVAPNQKLTHRFDVQNAGAADWTVRNIINGCRCVVVDSSNREFPAGRTTRVGIEFQPGSTPHDDLRKMIILFNEAAAPPVVLEVRAQVREALTVVPAELAYRRLGRGQSRDEMLEAQNYGEADWSGILVESLPPWLHARVMPVARRAEGSRPRQLCRILVTADSTGLSTGDHRAVLVIKPVGASPATQEIPVFASVTSPVNAIPAQLFFGKVVVGHPVTQHITLQFAPDAVPASPQAVLLDHNLGDQLHVSWSKSQGEFWELDAQLKANGTGDVSGAKLTIKFVNAKVPPLEVPVCFLVNPR